jgi:FMN phosphatase YigB (HAD superfamily)
MGGVVDYHAPVIPKIAHHLRMAEQDFVELAGHERFRGLLTGRLSTAAFWNEFSGITGKRVTDDLWATCFNPELNSEVVGLIAILKKRVRVVVGTNTLDVHYAIHQQRGNYAIFDAVYASNKIGLAKPDFAFYTYILEAEKCDAQNAVFIDDVEENVLAARDVGMTAVQFTTTRALRKDLKSLFPSLGASV